MNATARICDKPSEAAIHVWDHDEHVIFVIPLRMYDMMAIPEGIINLKKRRVRHCLN